MSDLCYADRMKHLHKTSLVTFFAATVLTAPTAFGQVVVQGEGDAALCYNSALSGNMGSRSAVRTCTEALSQALSRKDTAATFVNRGVLHMRADRQIEASSDYESALAIRPELTEAHINYGASLIQQGRDAEAMKAMNAALSDRESTKLPEAYYNRAILHERAGDVRAAYFDLRSALELRPDWPPALTSIARFDVKRKS